METGLSMVAINLVLIVLDLAIAHFWQMVLSGIFHFWKIYLLDFSGGSLVNNSSTNAGEIGLIPGLGRFHMLQGYEAHSPQLLSPCNLDPHTPRHKKPLQQEAHAPQLQSTACSPQLEKSPCSVKIQHSQK